MNTQLVTQDAAGRPALNLSALFYPSGQADLIRRPVQDMSSLLLARLFAAGAGPAPATLPRELPWASVKRGRGKLRRAQRATTTTVAIPGVHGTLTNFGRNPAFQELGDVEITLGGQPPRVINAATLKRLARQDDAVLLRKDGDTWRLCPDSWPIDLTDSSVEYRLGAVTIYS